MIFAGRLLPSLEKNNCCLALNGTKKARRNFLTAWKLVE
jgi:hypothetical protein